MSHVSHETAKRLQDAEFPKPTPEVGQFWYNAFGEAFVVINLLERRTFVSYLNQAKTAAILNEQFDFCIFAPTTEDILLQLPDGHALTRANQSMFICMKGEPLIGENGCHNNAAEAAAIDWFDTKGIEFRSDWMRKKLQTK